MFDFSWDMLSYFPAAVSTYSQAHDELFKLVYYLSVGIFLLVNAVLLYFVMRYRHRPGATSYHYHGNNIVEFTWTLLPTILFAGLGLYSDEMWKVMKYPSRVPTPDVEIDVVGQAFAWNVRYPGADGILGKRAPKYRSGANLFGIDPNDSHGNDDIVLTGESSTCRLTKTSSCICRRWTCCTATSCRTSASSKTQCRVRGLTFGSMA
jgi:cytochrome c oxidase subunit II